MLRPSQNRLPQTSVALQAPLPRSMDRRRKHTLWSELEHRSAEASGITALLGRAIEVTHCISDQTAFGYISIRSSREAVQHGFGPGGADFKYRSSKCIASRGSHAVQIACLISHDTSIRYSSISGSEIEA